MISIKDSLLFLIITIYLISCNSTGKEKINQGKLNELIIGSFSLEKDLYTTYINDIKVLEESGNTYLIFSTASNNIPKGIAFKFYDAITGKKVKEIDIPLEGPEALNPTPSFYHIESMNKIIAVSQFGKMAIYNPSGQIEKNIEGDFNYARSKEDFTRFESRKGLTYLKDNWLHVGMDPMNLFDGFTYSPKHQDWLLAINIETGESRKTSFGLPEGYNLFSSDITSTQLHGTFNPNNGTFLLGFPYSQEIYIIKDSELKDKKIFESNFKTNFAPSIKREFDGNMTVWEQPKEASTNIALIYDKYRDIVLRITKLNETGEGKTQFSRSKNYLLSIYSSDLNLKGEYTFSYETEMRIDNYFLTEQGLFINKPIQESDDYYEFYHIGLSNF